VVAERVAGGAHAVFLSREANHRGEEKRGHRDCCGGFSAG
jgi:hypothetical protein